MSPYILHVLRTQMQRCQTPTEFSSRAHRIRWARRDYRWVAGMTWTNAGKDGIMDMYSARRDLMLAQYNVASI